MKVKDLYKVETLDHRFKPADPSPLPNSQASRWRTAEYCLYMLVFLTIPVLMFKSVYDVSQPTHPNWQRFEQLLTDGWIPGRKVDNSDLQYRNFRNNVPYLAVLLILHPLLRRTWEVVRTRGGRSLAGQANGSASSKDSSSLAADARLRSRTTFDLIFGLIFITALHGVSALKVLVIVYINYRIGTSKHPYSGLMTWVFGIGILFANELCRGYRLGPLFQFLMPSTDIYYDDKNPMRTNWGAWVDGYGGLIPRWEVLFNFTVLRLIAFNFDLKWTERGEGSAVEKKNLDPTSLSEKDRIKSGAKPTDFTFRNYLSYILYSPLFLAGPIINFNDYISQSRHPLPTTTRTQILPYALRFAGCLLTMELCLHYLYVVAISKAQPDWTMYTPFQLSMLGYFNLHIIWLKLLLPWRFFRLWALLDGVDAPENMVRCMSDNYSTLAFWRSWHRSFNGWIIRYIYVPLGGSRVGRARAVGNFVAVFTFVALWHDINLKLLIWGWLIVLFVLPEIVATLLFPAKEWKGRPMAYRMLCGVGAVGNILMMMAANLVGFALGLDGLKGLVDGIVGSLGGRFFLLGACGTLFVGAQVMFEWREGERRRGIHMKC